MAIEPVKHRIDRELRHLWLEVCKQDMDVSRLDRLVLQYESLADNPVAFGPDNRSIFDSAASMTARAAEMVDEAPMSDVGNVPPVHPTAPPQSSPPASRTADIVSRERRLPRLAEIGAALDRSSRIVVFFFAFVFVLAVCLVILHRS